MEMEIPKNTVIHCPTEDLANEVIKFFNNYGIIRRGGNQWDEYGDLTCYHPLVAEKILHYCDLDWYEEKGCNVISAEEFLKNIVIWKRKKLKQKFLKK